MSYISLTRIYRISFKLVLLSNSDHKELCAMLQAVSTDRKTAPQYLAEEDPPCIFHDLKSTLLVSLWNQASKPIHWKLFGIFYLDFHSHLHLRLFNILLVAKSAPFPPQSFHFIHITVYTTFLTGYNPNRKREGINFLYYNHFFC